MNRKYFNDIKMPGSIKFSYIAEYFTNKDVTKIKKVLDVGGRNYSQIFFSDIFSNAEVFVLNFEKKDIEGCEMAILGDAQQLPFYSDEKMDVVIALDLIEHLIYPDEFFNNVKTVLKEKGIFILSTPNMAQIYNRIALLFGYGLFNYNPSNHYRLSVMGSKLSNQISEHKSVFTFNQMRKLLGIYGFKIEKVNGFAYTTSKGHTRSRKLRQLFDLILPLPVKEGHIFFCRI